MFTRILVPLDGSTRAEQVLPDAARLARAGGGIVTLVRVIRPLVEYEAMRPAPGVWLPAADNALRDAATAYLNELRAKEPLLDVATEAHVLVGPVAPMILRAANDERADLIVMSTQARKGIARWLQGSVAGEVIRDARVPVLVLREAAMPLASGLAAGQPVSALVPLDGSSLAEAALEPAVQLAVAMSQGVGGSIHLLRVVDPPPERTGSDSPAARQEHTERRRAIRRELRDAREYLDTTAAGVRKLYADAHGVSVTWSVARGHNAAEAILRATRAEGGTARADQPESVNVVAMGTHGRGGLKRWIMGSVADRVVREAAMPVLIVRPRASDLDAVVRPAESVEVADQDEGGLRLA